VGYENTLQSEIRVISMPEGKDPDDVIREDIERWRELVGRAVPLIDFLFEKTTAKLDLNTARDKSLAVERLLPVISNINDPIRQAHYLQKLAGLVKVDMNTIKAALSRLKPSPSRRNIPPSKMASHAAKDLREEYCLALLMQHPELRERLGELTPEYFENSENREIFNAYKETPDVVSLKGRTDPAIHEHIETISSKTIPASKNNIEPKFTDCVLELRKRYLKNLAARRAESGGTEEDTSGLEQDMEISRQLKDLEVRRSQKYNSSYRTRGAENGR
jgi:DNA primase